MSEENCENYSERGIPYDDYDILANICEAVKLLREIRLEEARLTEKAMVTKALDALEHSLHRWDYPCEMEDTAEKSEEEGLEFEGATVSKTVQTDDRRPIEDLKERLLENAQKIANGETVTAEEALEKASEDVSEKSDKLEPVAWLDEDNGSILYVPQDESYPANIRQFDENMIGSVMSRKRLREHGDEPLVRLSDVIQWIREKEIGHNPTGEFLIKEDELENLKEFTQQSKGGSTE